MWTPTDACVAPGPRVTRQIPGPSRELPERLGHVGRAGLVPARDVADGAVDQAVEDVDVALPGNAEREVDAVERQLVDEDPAAGAAHRGRAIACSRRTDADCSHRDAVGRLEVADGPLARPLGGQHQRAHERGLEVRRRPCEDGVGPALEPRAAGPVERRPSLRLDLDLALQQVADARPGVGVAVCDAAERELDPVAPHDPGGERVELHEVRDQRALGVELVVVELPDERRPVDLGRPEARDRGTQVVDDAVAADRLDAGIEVVEREPQCTCLNGSTARRR